MHPLDAATAALGLVQAARVELSDRLGKLIREFSRCQYDMPICHEPCPDPDGSTCPGEYVERVRKRLEALKASIEDDLDDSEGDLRSNRKHQRRLDELHADSQGACA